MVDAAPRNPPTLATLLKRLADYGAVVPSDAHPNSIAWVIEHLKLELVQCAGAVTDGKWQPAVNFERYYAAVFGRGLDGKAVKQRRRA